MKLKRRITSFFIKNITTIRDVSVCVWLFLFGYIIGNSGSDSQKIIAESWKTTFTTCKNALDLSYSLSDSCVEKLKQERASWESAAGEAKKALLMADGIIEDYKKKVGCQ